MKEYVDEYRFRDRFLQSSNYKNNFSYEGLTALFEYIEELEDDCDEEIEFDMIAIHVKDGYHLDDIREETVVIEIPDTERFITGEF